MRSDLSRCTGRGGHGGWSSMCERSGAFRVVCMACEGEASVLSPPQALAPRGSSPRPSCSSLAVAPAGRSSVLAHAATHQAPAALPLLPLPLPDLLPLNSDSDDHVESIAYRRC